MVPVAKLELVERLLAEGELSHREIALTARVSRTTVQAIAGGRVSSTKQRERMLRRATHSSSFTGWCPACGCTVYLPCYACALRAHLAGGPAPTLLPPCDKHPRTFLGRDADPA